MIRTIYCKKTPPVRLTIGGVYCFWILFDNYATNTKSVFVLHNAELDIDNLVSHGRVSRNIVLYVL